MITTGIIRSISGITNTCTVQLPIFEGAGNEQEVILEATFSIAPGHFNNYLVGDTVYVSFVDNTINEPVIIGKVYEGIAKEVETERLGASTVDSLVVKEQAVMPGNTAFKTTNGIHNVGASVVTANDIVNGLKELQISTPTNVVTLDTTQTITGKKTMENLVVSGGDAKAMHLDKNNGFGRINDSDTSTLLGLNGPANGTANELLVGHSNYKLSLRGSQTRPTYLNKEVALLEDVTSIYRFKGSVNSYSDLPTTGQQPGDAYNILTADPTHEIVAGDTVAWTGTEWKKINTGDLSNYLPITGGTISNSATTDAPLTIKGDEDSVFLKLSLNDASNTTKQIGFKSDSDVPYYYNGSTYKKFITEDNSNTFTAAQTIQANNTALTIKANTTNTASNAKIGGITIGDQLVTDTMLVEGISSSENKELYINSDSGIFLGKSATDNLLSIGASIKTNTNETVDTRKVCINKRSIGDTTDIWEEVLTTGTQVAIEQKAIEKVIIEYQLGNSPTIVPTGDWSETAPVWVDGKYMWQRTSYKYISSETPTVISSTCISGAKGATGEKGDNGTPITFLGTHESDPTDPNINDSYRNSTDGKTYIYTATGWTLMTIDGAKGAKGDAGADGRGISTTEIRYAQTETKVDPSTIAEADWKKSITTITDGYYLWTRTKINYTSGDPSITYNYSRDPQDGVDGKGISSTEIKYAISASNTEPPTTETDWTIDVPEVTADKPYLWTRTIITYTDETTSDPAYSVVKNGQDGDPGTSAFYITILNEYDSIPVKADGIVPADYKWKDNTEHIISANCGTAPVGFKVSNTVPTTADGYTLVYSYDSDILEFKGENKTTAVDSYSAWVAGKGVKGLSEDTAKVIYTLYSGTLLVASTEFTVAKVYGGEDGEDGNDAVDYYISAEPNTIKATKTGGLSSANIKFSFKKQSGNNDPVDASVYYKYFVDGVQKGTGTNTSVTLTSTGDTPDFTADNNSLKVEIYKDNTEAVKYDTETITIIKDGIDGRAYRLSISSPIHTGSLQQADISVKAYVNTGETEGIDPNAIIFVDGVYKASGEFTIPASYINNKTNDILVEAKHDGVLFDSEVITYVPQNTPTLDLNNDSAALVYDGNTKVVSTDSVSSTATLYLNGGPISGSSTATYIPVEYIQSNGTQYIDTGITGDNNTRVKIKYYPEIITEGSEGLFGSRVSYDSNGFCFYPYWGNSNFAQYGNNYSGVGTYTQALTELDFNKNNVYLNNTLAHTFNSATFTCPGTMTLFGTYDSGTSKIDYSHAKVYSCKIWSNDTLVRDFIPAINPATNKAGMYDLVSKTWFMSKTSFDFTAGDALYTNLDYIESDGTQYIDTGVRVAPGLSAELTFDATAGTGWSKLFGYSQGGYGPMALWIDVNTLKYYYQDSGTGTAFTGLGTVGSKITKTITGSFTATYSATLLINELNTTLTSYVKPKVKWYAVKIKNNDILVRDFIPAKRNSDNAIGLYDLITGVFYENNGTGTFIAGPTGGSVSYLWTLTNCKSGELTQVSGAAVTVDSIDDNKTIANASCTATYNGKQYGPKIFMISKQLKGAQGTGGKTALVKTEYAYLYCDHFESQPTEGPSGTLTEVAWTSAQKNTWYYISDTPVVSAARPVIFRATRTGYYYEDTPETVQWNSWDPTWSQIWKSWYSAKGINVLKTAEGLFGGGEGVYYTCRITITYDDKTYKPGDKIEASIVAKILATWTAELSHTATNNGKYFECDSFISDITTYYSYDSTATKFVSHTITSAEEFSQKKTSYNTLYINITDVFSVYVDATYIKTGALKVENENGTLFEAGLSDGNVSIGGYTVDDVSLQSESGNVGMSSSTGTGDYSFWAGSSDKANAPFRVANDGALTATFGNIAGYSIGDTKLSSGNGNGTIVLQSDKSNTEYVPAVYIESNGSQYIDTGITANNNTSIEIDFGSDASGDSIFGGDAGTGYYFNYTSSSTYPGGYLYYKGTSFGSSSTTGRQTIKVDGPNKKMYRNDVEVADLSSVTSFTDSHSLLLFARSNITAASGVDDWGKWKLYSCKIWQNGILARNYIPIYRQGKFGLLDLVNHTYYFSNTSTNFDGSINETQEHIIIRNGTKYQRLDYIQSDGTNYIDTDYAYSTTDSLEIIMTPNDENTLFGGGNYTTAHGEIYLGSRKWVATILEHRATSNDAYLWEASELGTKKTIVYNSSTQAVYVDNVEKTQIMRDYTTNYSIYLFCLNRANEVYNKCNAKLYSFKVTRSGSDIHNFVPAKDLSNNSIGILDLVTGSFKTQAAGNNFSYGELAITSGEVFIDGNDTYRILKYIESSGTQYIDTGVKPTATIGTDIIYSGVNLGADENIYFGVSSASGYADGYNYCLETSGSVGQAIALGSNYKIAKVQFESGANYHIRYNMNGDCKYMVNGITYITFETPTLPSNYNIYLFCRNIAGSKDTTYQKYNTRIYSCKIYEGETLIRNFVPVLKNAVEYGLYDFANGVWYGNAGTGTFTGAGYPYEFNSIYLGSEEEATAPFRVTNTGKLYAEEANIRGTIYAEDGYFNGSGIFKGEVYASSGNFTGSINSSAGTIGAFTLSPTQLKSSALQIDDSGIQIFNANDNRLRLELTNNNTASLYSTMPNFEIYSTINGEKAGFKYTAESSSETISRYIRFQISETLDTTEISGTKYAKATIYWGIYADSACEQSVSELATPVNVKFSGWIIWQNRIGGARTAVQVEQTIPNIVTANKAGYTLLFARPASVSVNYVTWDKTSTHGAVGEYHDFYFNWVNYNAYATYDLQEAGGYNLYGNIYKIALQISQPGEASPKIFSLNHIYPYIPENNDSDSGLMLGDATHYWHSIHTKNTYNASSAGTQSDRNRKHDIAQLDNKYSDLFDKLSPVTFKYNDGTSNRNHIGFIAQDVEDAHLNSGLTLQDSGTVINNEGQYYIRYEEFIALNTDQIQKLKKRTLELETENKELKERLLAIEEKLNINKETNES